MNQKPLCSKYFDEFLPLMLVETYLVATLLLFYFGPVKFKIHNELLFTAFLLIYHASFILGYVVAIRVKSRRVNLVVESSFSTATYWLLFSFGLVGVWAAYRNIMMMDGVIPDDFFGDLVRGFTEPGAAYTERMQNMENDQSSGSRLFNVISIFFAFSKLLFIFYFLRYWGFLSVAKKFISILYSLLFISAGISAGVNSIVFVFFMFSSVSFLAILYERRYKHLNKIFIVCGLLFILPITWFGKIMSERGGGFEYFASTSPLGDISIVSTFNLDATSTFLGFLYYSFVWLSYYVCQGYYGFSLILNLDLQWTYGFGNSDFLQRQLLMISGEDISSLTFQSRIDHLWDKSAQWHSFYGQFANDFGLIGLSLLLFAIGCMFGKVWKSVLYEKNFYGLALLPIFSIMFIFFPANNQIFGYIDTFSYFIFVSLLWAFNSKKKIRI